MSDLPPISERSYGIIALRYLASLSPPYPPPSTSNTELLLIKQKTLLAERPAFWSFPKGHAEAGDTSPISTAIRELEEETSLCVRPENILKFASASASASGGDGGEMEGRNAVEWDGSFAERYLNPVRRVGKEVRFWVAVLDKEEAEREIRVQEEEVEGYRWCSWEEAFKMMTFDAGRNMLKRVRDCLENKEKVEVEIKAKV